MPKRPPTNSAAPSAVDQIIAAIARTHLDLETLESRGSDGLDFKDHACWAIRDALRAAFEAGRQAAPRGDRTASGAQPTVIAGDIAIISAKHAPGPARWVHGRIGDFRFAAKVCLVHAAVPRYEIGRSRISKLELRRLDNDAIAYAWDRGLDVAATDAEAQHAVDRLAQHLADHCFGPVSK